MSDEVMNLITVEVRALYVAGDNLQGVARRAMELTLEGIVGDEKHYGFIKKADPRDWGIPDKGKPVRNWRQWSAVSVEELQQMATALGIDELDGALIGANITFAGVTALSQVAAGSTIRFSKGGVILTVDRENKPCMGSGQAIARVHPTVKPQQFPLVALHKRGLVGTIYVAGVIEVGDVAMIYPPY